MVDHATLVVDQVAGLLVVVAAVLAVAVEHGACATSVEGQTAGAGQSLVAWHAEAAD